MASPLRRTAVCFRNYVSRSMKGFINDRLDRLTEVAKAASWQTDGFPVLSLDATRMWPYILGCCKWTQDPKMRSIALALSCSSSGRGSYHQDGCGAVNNSF